MNWFYNMKIKAKMILSFFVVIALMIALSVFAIVQMRFIEEQNLYVKDFASARETILLQLQANIRDMRRVTATMAMYTPLGDMTKIEPLISESAALFISNNEIIDQYESIVKTDFEFTHEEIAQHLTKAAFMRQTVNDYKTEVCDVLILNARNGDYDDALVTIANSSEIIASLHDSINELVNSSIESAKEANQFAVAATSNSTIFIIVIAASAALIAVIIALFVASSLSGPLITLSTFMKKAGTIGDLTLSPEDISLISKLGEKKDELGNTIGGAATFVKHVIKIADELVSVSNGDLSREITLLSENDIMGTSLKKVIDNFNNMFSEIQMSTEQVSTSSKQIAEGAQVLALGATQQAASIQELSSSIAEISEKTKTNAVTANKTSKLSTTIKENAEKGSRQMNDMITAVKDINDASQSISKIIKKIDDIAFQTNILALNAAVEAARAGQHGKGFAVVAEEVRNLASKSADAAKDTGNMIQDSMDKALLGSRIAGETALSLNEIVDGIKETTSFIDEIACASEQQSIGISQINIGIGQVAQVVQQNSATAEQSASASEEMSGQSDVLLQLISQFRLKDSDVMFQNKPSDGSQGRKRLTASKNTDYTIC